ncbi:MAG: ATP-binding protein [Aeromicrobium sp.]|nr:ATP-binding protein [Aeromicrobium sp.]
MENAGGIPVGTVVGVSSTTEFQMQVRPDAVRAQDLVAVDTIEEGQTYRVWAKVGAIERLNPLFPREAAQELAFQGRDPVDSVISMSREMITATCRVVGVQRDGRLEPPKYPVQPAGRVYVPPAEEIESFLVGDTPEHRRLYLGTERGNKDVRVFVDGHMVVSRHLAVLASTGAGKTVATRRVIDELRDKGYPVLIFDPHGDYERLAPKPGNTVTSYVPDINLGAESIDQVISYLAGLSGEELTPPQLSFVTALMNVLTDSRLVARMNDALREQGLQPLTETLARNHFHAISAAAAVIQELKAADDRVPLPREISTLAPGLNVGAGTANAVRRQAGTASKQYANMRKMNRARMESASPLPVGEGLRGIIKDGHVARIVLEGYSEALRQSLVANIMQELLAARVDDQVPRFVTVIEEAHNFIPGWNAGGAAAGEAPSLPVIKQIATEGRKYGMGLIFISQRPSRIDSTVLSQANSFLIMKIVNPNDQKYIRDVVETMGEDEAKSLPSLNTGEALLSGSFTRIPVMVRVEKSRSEGKHEEEDFLAGVKAPGGAALAAEESGGWGR